MRTQAHIHRAERIGVTVLLARPSHGQSQKAPWNRILDPPSVWCASAEARALADNVLRSQADTREMADIGVPRRRAGHSRYGGAFDSALGRAIASAVDHEWLDHLSMPTNRGGVERGNRPNRLATALSQAISWLVASMLWLAPRAGPQAAHNEHRGRATSRIAVQASGLTR